MCFYILPLCHWDMLVEERLLDASANAHKVLLVSPQIPLHMSVPFYITMNIIVANIFLKHGLEWGT